MTDENQMAIKVKFQAESLTVACEVLCDIDGVIAIEYNDDVHMTIIYDVTRTRWKTLRDRLRGLGVYQQNGIIARWRDVLHDYQEQNMRDNLGYKPACCSKPPVGSGRR